MEAASVLWLLFTALSSRGIYRGSPIPNRPIHGFHGLHGGLWPVGQEFRHHRDRLMAGRPLLMARGLGRRCGAQSVTCFTRLVSMSTCQ